MTDSIYSGKLRIRVAGLLVKDGKLLLVKLASPISKKDIWTPPGGGVEFGESIHQALKREFKEETGLEISIADLVHVNELLELPFHAIEFFFRVTEVSGELMVGNDPEHKADKQLLKEVRFFDSKGLENISLSPDLLKKMDWKLSASASFSARFKDEEG